MFAIPERRVRGLPDCWEIAISVPFPSTKREEVRMSHAPTFFGSLSDYQKGSVEIVTGDARH
ncbi:MAG: hypothetical protein ACT60Q_11470, partial [Ferrovibrionaceae bacterium]